MRVRPSEKSLEEVAASRPWPTEKIERGDADEAAGFGQV